LFVNFSQIFQLHSQLLLFNFASAFGAGSTAGLSLLIGEGLLGLGVGLVPGLVFGDGLVPGCVFGSAKVTDSLNDSNF